MTSPYKINRINSLVDSVETVRDSLAVFKEGVLPFGKTDQQEDSFSPVYDGPTLPRKPLDISVTSSPLSNNEVLVEHSPNTLSEVLCDKEVREPKEVSALIFPSSTGEVTVKHSPNTVETLLIEQSPYEAEVIVKHSPNTPEIDQVLKSPSSLTSIDVLFSPSSVSQVLLNPSSVGSIDIETTPSPVVLVDSGIAPVMTKAPEVRHSPNQVSNVSTNPGSVSLVELEQSPRAISDLQVVSTPSTSSDVLVEYSPNTPVSLDRVLGPSKLDSVVVEHSPNKPSILELSYPANTLNNVDVKHSPNSPDTLTIESLIDTDGDGVYDGDDYFFNDPYETITFQKLQSSGFSNSTIAIWDIVKFIGESEPGLDQGEFYMVTEIEPSPPYGNFYRVADRSGSAIYDSTIRRIADAGRGGKWQKILKGVSAVSVAHSPNSVSDVSSALLPSKVSSVSVDRSPCEPCEIDVSYNDDEPPVLPVPNQVSYISISNTPSTPSNISTGTSPSIPNISVQHSPNAVSTFLAGTFIHDPDFIFDSENFSQDIGAHHIMLKVPRVTAGIDYPAGYVFQTTGSSGDFNLVRAEDPLRPREEPYANTTENKNSGAWRWFYLSNRGIKWEFAKTET